MKKTLLIWLAILYLVCSSYSQNDNLYGFYYANGTRHYWQEDFTSAIIIVRNINHYDSIAASLRKVFNSTDDVVLADDEDNYVVKAKSTNTGNFHTYYYETAN